MHSSKLITFSFQENCNVKVFAKPGQAVVCQPNTDHYSFTVCVYFKKKKKVPRKAPAAQVPGKTTTETVPALQTILIPEVNETNSPQTASLAAEAYGDSSLHQHTSHITKEVGHYDVRHRGTAAMKPLKQSTSHPICP